jgi:elongator complex protein 3
MRSHHRYDFKPEAFEAKIAAIVAELHSLPSGDRALMALLRRHPKNRSDLFKKSELIRGVRWFADKYGWDADRICSRLRMKPVRTQSGVAPVTVLTRPFPCPGTCIFCPNDVRMPKSYLSMEPGAQRATQNRFDPYAQTGSRLVAFRMNGHRTDKVELILLGGTWSFYPEPYQIWFVERCFAAMNEYREDHPPPPDPSFSDFTDARASGTYNETIVKLQANLQTEREHASWSQLEEAHRRNEEAESRCVGLVVETRPDYVTEEEVLRIRRLGCTKVQLGFQSLDDRVLLMNRRGHDVAATRKAMRLLRQAGFKIHAHWMPNLYGSDPARDREDFLRIFADPDFRPDELKIYPCSLIESAELMRYYRSGEWRPYSEEELVELVADCMLAVPPYCRTTRVIRDIPSHDIVEGNKISNLRELAERSIARRGGRCRDIRAREIRRDDAAELRLEELEYRTSIGRELFLQYVTPEDRIVGFLRLSLPETPSFVSELGASALIREVHVYGQVVGLDEESDARPQHAGLGRALIERAVEIARDDRRRNVAVISAIGTRAYYRKVGFEDGALYQHRGV